MTTDDWIIDKFAGAQENLVLQSADLSLRTLASMVQSGAIDVSPQFQRRDRWDLGKQGALIESFLFNIPVPPIYLAEDELGTYSVIDGKQRITAITSFLQDELSLRGLIRFEEIEGLKFSELPRVLQNALDLRPLRAVTLLKQSDPELKYEVFHRLNTGGEILNPQEIRNVIFRGPMNNLIYELGAHPFLRNQLKIYHERSAAYRKMTDAEYALRFLTLAENWRDFSGDLSFSMSHFMEVHRFAKVRDLRLHRRRFLRSLDACAAIYGDLAFKRPDAGYWRDQALAGMYDAEMVAIAELSDATLRRAISHADVVLGATVELFEDPLFDEAVRTGTNTPSRVKYRIEQLSGALESV